jgi:hypothetical protein
MTASTPASTPFAFQTENNTDNNVQHFGLDCAFADSTALSMG